MRPGVRAVDAALVVWTVAWLIAAAVTYSSLKELEDGGPAVISAGDGLRETSEGLSRAGRGLHETAAALEIVGDLPFVSGNPGEAVEQTADDLDDFAVRVRQTGRDARVTGAQARDSAGTLAIVLGWAAAALAAAFYLPSLEQAGGETSLVGLVPKDAESIETGTRAAELFSVPVVTHTHVVQRNPDGLSKPALRRVARRAERIADERDPELADVRFALPLVNARQLVPSSRETGTTAITYLFFDPAQTDIEDQDELTQRFAEKYVHFEDDNLVGITGAVPARMQEWREIEAGLPWGALATGLLIAP